MPPLRCRRALPGLLLASGLVCGGLTGCSATAPGQAGPAPSVTHRTKPAPVRTIVRSGPTVPAGATAVFRTAQHGVGLRLTASRPAVSRERLSRTYGYPPQHGYYVTFRLTIRNTGTVAIPLGPAYFVVRVAGEGRVTTEDGNAAYSGASRQLDNTQLDAGQVLRGPVTYDVGRPHGVLSFAPDGSPALSWRF